MMFSEMMGMNAEERRVFLEERRAEQHARIAQRRKRQKWIDRGDLVLRGVGYTLAFVLFAMFVALVFLALAACIHLLWTTAF